MMSQEGNALRAVVVNAYGRSNRGDGVLLDECVEDIRAFDPAAQITVALFEGCSEGGGASREYLTERIGNARGKGVLKRVRTVFYLGAALAAALLPRFGFDRFLPAEQRRTLLAMRRADIIVSAPGGYIHDTNAALYVALFHLFLGSVLGKPLLLAPQSIGPVRGAFGRWVTYRTLRRADRICTREKFSYDFLIGLGLNGPQIVPSGDSAFWSDDVECDPSVVSSEAGKLGLAETDRVLGVTVVGWSFPYHPNKDAAYSNYVSSLAAAITHLARENDLRPVIFNQVSDDIPTAMVVARLCGVPVVVDEAERSPRLLRALIARSHIFVGTRFHSCIFAMIAGRPTLAVAYLPKTRHILADLGLDHGCVDIDAADAGTLIALGSRLAAEPDRAAAETREAVARYKTSRVRFRDVLARMRITRGQSLCT